MKLEKQDIWKNKFEGKFPIDFQFKHDLYKRWFRIHYLPESKRYPETELEYKTVQYRQVKILNDIIGESSEIELLIGMHNYEDNTELEIKTDLGIFKYFISVDLYKNQDKLYYGPYNEGDKYETYIRTTNLKANELLTTLKQIADGSYEYRFSIVDFNKGRIIIPYDGGIDIIMENENQKKLAKTKYKEWLSNRKDGL